MCMRSKSETDVKFLSVVECNKVNIKYTKNSHMLHLHVEEKHKIRRNYPNLSKLTKSVVIVNNVICISGTVNTPVAFFNWT